MNSPNELGLVPEVEQGQWVRVEPGVGMEVGSGVGVEIGPGLEVGIRVGPGVELEPVVVEPVARVVAKIKNKTA